VTSLVNYSDIGIPRVTVAWAAALRRVQARRDVRSGVILNTYYFKNRDFVKMITGISA